MPSKPKTKSRKRKSNNFSACKRSLARKFPEGSNVYFAPIVFNNLKNNGTDKWYISEQFGYMANDLSNNRSSIYRPYSALHLDVKDKFVKGTSMGVLCSRSKKQFYLMVEYPNSEGKLVNFGFKVEHLLTPEQWHDSRGTRIGEMYSI